MVDIGLLNFTFAQLSKTLLKYRKIFTKETMNEPVFKYRIDELLNNLTVKDYRKALLIVPQLLSISQKTFNNYRKIKLEDKQDIPHEKVVILEKLFSIKPGELQNFTFNVEPIFDLSEANDYDLEPLRVHR